MQGQVMFKECSEAWTCRTYFQDSGIKNIRHATKYLFVSKDLNGILFDV